MKVPRRDVLQNIAGAWAMALLFFGFTSAALAQRNSGVASDEVINEPRIALVIGNSAYKDSPLKNPANDATDVAQALRKLGFNVTLRTNANQKQMKQALREFGQSLRKGGVGLFYYAGHGVQAKGRNYLIPIGASIEDEAEVEDESVDANLVLSYMEDAQNRVNLVILDACRNNPFARSFRSASRGLAQMDAATGSLLAYATSPGSVAADGDGRNGIYTKHLLQHLSEPGVPVELMFKRVRNGVLEETNKRQTPWENSSLRGSDFYFVPPAVRREEELRQKLQDEAKLKEQTKKELEQQEQTKRKAKLDEEKRAQQQARLDEEKRLAAEREEAARQEIVLDPAKQRADREAAEREAARKNKEIGERRATVVPPTF